ncbi:hypothetical protein [Pseudoalteromonas luteoviolacea]|uniref:hypothetical protein n=1 Tax=Pseudoalteromonas luteoviolacea TaxID=43657 RepID=UPI00114F2219|nr:hypothetical protein [Pseudoalteromonas luteoviolacea]TQF67995.1 hypothetical protein FLM44_22755 [Pseudoalteromonas luteoviolacea]
MKSTATNLAKNMISPSLWDIYKDVYFCLFNAAYHYLDGAIISLWNPEGKTYDRIQNRALAKKYISLMSRQNNKTKYLYGGNQDMSYRELSVSINTSLINAQKMAQRCHQKAFYYLDNGEITLYNSADLQQHYVLNTHLLSRLSHTPMPKTNLALSSLSK